MVQPRHKPEHVVGGPRIPGERQTNEGMRRKRRTNGKREGEKHSAACKFDLAKLSVAYIVSCEVTVAWLSAGYNEFGIVERGTTAGDDRRTRNGTEATDPGGWRGVAGIICLSGLESVHARSRANKHAVENQREKEVGRD